MFRGKWRIGSVQRLCFELILWTGARISDAAKIGPVMVGRDGMLQFTQQKTGEPAFVPWTCALPAHGRDMRADRDMMHAALGARSEIHMTFLATAQGRTRSSKALGHVISDAAKEIVGAWSPQGRCEGLDRGRGDGPPDRDLDGTHHA